VLVPAGNLVLGGSGGNRTLTVTAAAGQTGTATITLRVTDGDGAATSRSFVLTVNAPLVAASGSDEFSGSALDTTRWSWVNPRQDASVSVWSGALRIQVPGGVGHDVWSGGNYAPRVMQTVSNGDFTLVARFLSGVTKKYQLQGFIVQQDAANYLRFDVYSDGSQVRVFAASFVDGQPGTKVSRTITATTGCHLRVIRAGNQWTLAYSYDGTTWTTAGGFSRTLAVKQAGLFAGNAAGSTSPAFTAVVDYFRLATTAGAVLAASTPGSLAEVAPALSIEALPTGAVRISWPASAVPFRLESAPRLGGDPSSDWQPVTSEPVLFEGVYQLTTESAGVRFFRLVSPAPEGDQADQ
jgi:regulation of enolase protein 1 (concanavalin A-like superfamily)